jgi:molybdate transport system substrate-binding protein
MTWSSVLTAQTETVRQAKVADAKPGDVRLIVSNGIRVPLETVRAQAEKAVGHPFVIEYGTSVGLKPTIESRAFDVAILTPQVFDEMIAKGKLAAGTRFDIARVLVGAGQRGGIGKRDISTPAAVKETLLNAKAVHWTSTAAAVATIDKMLDSLGIRSQITPRLEAAGIPLSGDEYELTITLASELISLKDQLYLGTLPREFQVPVVMCAGIGAGGDQNAARALINFLRGPAIESALKANGMER